MALVTTMLEVIVRWRERGGRYKEIESTGLAVTSHTVLTCHEIIHQPGDDEEGGMSSFGFSMLVSWCMHMLAPLEAMTACSHGI